jgi:hypothetical protein
VNARRFGSLRLGLTAAAVVVAGIAAGCSAFIVHAPTPMSCADKFSERRCEVMADSAAWKLGVTRESVVGIEVLPMPTSESGGAVTLGGPPDVVVAVKLLDGSVREVGMGCGGVAEDWNPACQDDPQVQVRSVADGYRDVPAGSTPVPSAAPDALADARALAIDRLAIPIDHTGPYEVRLGEARLPNGLLTAASIALTEPWPSHVAIIDPEGVVLRLRSLEPDGSPFVNIYDHGWRPGPERVEAYLTFDVFRFDPGAVLSVEDVVVQ